MGEGERFQLGTIGALSLSVVSSVSIVICNKALMSSLHFIFGILTKLSSSCKVNILVCLVLLGQFSDHLRWLHPYLLYFCVLSRDSVFNFCCCFIRLNHRIEDLEQLYILLVLLYIPSRVLLEIESCFLYLLLPYSPPVQLQIILYQWSGQLIQLPTWQHCNYCSTTLTSWHLLVTFCSLHMGLRMRFFEHKPFEQKAVMGFGILNGISIGLLNLSLGFNSVGFYQMTKLAIIPCTVLLETLFLGRRFSKRIQLSLVILLLGVGIATVTDLQLNALGSFLSLLAVITTCVAQIMTNTIQKKYKVSSTQLLYQSCPYQAGTLLISGPFLDKLLTNRNVFAFEYTTQVMLFIILSCLISISVNFSTFLVIGKTSPVTYQVLGHLKTCLVLAFGYVLLHDPFSWRNILGILIALIGMILYSYCCTLENQQKAAEAAAAEESQARVGESEALLNVENGSVALSNSGGQKAPAWGKDKS